MTTWRVLTILGWTCLVLAVVGAVAATALVVVWNEIASIGLIAALPVFTLGIGLLVVARNARERAGR